MPGLPGEGITLAFTPVLADTQTVTREAVAVAVIVALLAGWYGRMWREREADHSFARTRAANARKAVWKARWVIVVVGIVVVATVDVLLHGGG
jgi:protein-S-isoprenylcysteine O-methyltransferase Ste14